MFNRNRRCGCNCGCEYMITETDDCGCEYNDTDMTDCGCGFDEVESPFPTNPMLAQSYVPIQKMKRTFTPHCALKMGTIFPELVSPYMPCQSMRENEYIAERNTIKEGCNKCQ